MLLHQRVFKYTITINNWNNQYDDNNNKKNNVTEVVYQTIKINAVKHKSYLLHCSMKLAQQCK